jgi:two-component system response regulator (stage 0 sporulation protein A)
MQTMQFKIRPRVCIYSSVSHDRMTSQILALGAMFMIIKPTPSDIIIERLRMIAGVPVTPTVINFGLSDLLHNLEAYVTKLIRKIGIPSHLVGQKYLRTAILMALDDSSLLESITKGLYPTVAKVYGITNPKVERDIRHSIDVAWANGGAKALNNFLGEPEAAEGPRPTNSEFIALVVDRLTLLIKEQKEKEEKIPVN